MDREAPFWFTKSPHARIGSDTTPPYPPGTADDQREYELVWKLPELIADLSTLYRLQPGEVEGGGSVALTVGTPAGT